MFPTGTTHTLQITGNKVEILVHIPGQKSYVETPSLEVQKYFDCGEAFTQMEKSLNAISAKSTHNISVLNPKPIFSGKQQHPPLSQQPTHKKPSI